MRTAQRVVDDGKSTIRMLPLERWRKSHGKGALCVDRREGVQSFVCTKSVLMDFPEIIRGAVPVLLSVTDWLGLVVPTS